MKTQGLALFSLLGASPAGLAAQDGKALMRTWRTAGSQLRAVGLLEGVTRADLLPPVRDFARRFYPLEGNLSEEWHTHFLELVATEGAEVGTTGGAEPLQRLLPELPNIEAAIETAGRKGSVRHAPKVATGLADAIRFGGLEGVHVLDRLAEFCELSQDRYGAGAALFYGSLVLFDRSDYEESEIRCERALAFFEAEGRQLGQANAMKALADLDRSLGRTDGAEWRVAKALDLYRAEGDLLGQGNCVLMQARISRDTGRGGDAEQLLREAARLYADADALLGEGNCLIMRGEIASERHEFADAKALFVEAVAKEIPKG